MKARMPGTGKRNVGKEILKPLKEFKAGREGKVTLRRHVVERKPASKAATMSDRLKITRGSGNIFHDIGFAPEEAENLKLRSGLMMRIEDYCKKSGATQAAAAKVLGLTTPRLNALVKGKINLFSLDALAHTIADQVEAAYRRGDLFEKRTALMAEWAEYCARAKSNKIVQLRPHSTA